MSIRCLVHTVTLYYSIILPVEDCTRLAVNSPYLKNNFTIRKYFFPLGKKKFISTSRKTTDKVWLLNVAKDEKYSCNGCPAISIVQFKFSLINTRSRVPLACFWEEKTFCVVRSANCLYISKYFVVFS